MGVTLIGVATAADYHWKFNNLNDLDGWTLDGWTNKDVVNGTLKATATRGNPFIFTPKVEINADNQGSIMFSMKINRGIPMKGCILFITEDRPNYIDAALVSFLCKTDGESHEYEIDMSKNPLWKGKVTQLRFQLNYPGTLSQDQRTVEIEYFRVPDSMSPAAKRP